MKRFYITTTLPYVNAKPHIGFALEITQADAIVRYQRLRGHEVFYNTGTDEHGLKIYRQALAKGYEPQAYCDEWAETFRGLQTILNLDNPTFIRTTDKHHVKAAQEFWRRCREEGDIYKKNYQVKYCVGCELEKTDSELREGRCPVHPNLDLELIDEENYFFKFSRYTEPLHSFYKNNPDFVVPENRYTEIINFVKSGLEDFSISRLKSKMPWGVPVPDDDEHVMYVWFDALINYISTLGWPDSAPDGAAPGKPVDFAGFWGTKEKPNAVQVAGKDNLRQQTAMWQAMLMSADLPNSRQVFIHGFISSGGQKMSKSLGNVVDPYELVDNYGTDALRYYLLGSMPAYDDGDFTIDKFEEYYTAHLVNGVGNLTSRILSMVEKYQKITDKRYEIVEFFDTAVFWEKYDAAFSEYKFDDAVRMTQDLVGQFDRLINEQKPWEKVKNGEDITELLYKLSEGLRHMAIALLPIIPVSAQEILERLGTVDKSRNWGKLEKNAIINKGDALFPRL